MKMLHTKISKNKLAINQETNKGDWDTKTKKKYIYMHHRSRIWDGDWK